MIGIKKSLAESVSHWGVINNACLLLAGMSNRMQFVNNMYVRMDDDGPDKIKNTLFHYQKFDNQMIAEIAERLLTCIEAVGDVMNGRDIISESDDPLINQFNRTKEHLELLKKNGE